MNLRKKLIERHKVSDNPGGNCYLLMTAASADTRTHTLRLEVCEDDTVCVVGVCVRRLEVNDMRNGCFVGSVDSVSQRLLFSWCLQKQG